MNNLCIEECSILSSLTTTDTPSNIREIVKSDIKTKTYYKGEYLFINDQEVQALVGINSGLARMYFMDHFGNEFTVKIMKKGDVTGYMQIIENEKYFGYVQVMEDAEICLLTKNTLLRVMEMEISVNRRVIEKLCNDLRVSKEVIANLSLKDVKHRICSILIKLHKQFGIPGQDEINADLSREDFAKLVGVARESLSRSLSEISNEGIISIDKKKIKILDWVKLHKYSKI